MNMAETSFYFDKIIKNAHLKNKLTLLCPLFFLLALTTFSQQINGYWYGVGTIKKQGSHNSYLSELIINQKGSRITGEYNYFFRSSLIKSKITGTYNAKTRELLLNAIPILNYKSRNESGADCIMEGSFTLRISRIETALLGQFNPTNTYKFTCPAINVKFVKGSPEDKISLNEKEVPESDSEVVATPPLAELNKPPALDTLKHVPIDLTKNIVEKLNERAFEAPPVIDVDSDTLKITLYDNGEVDNDTISLFYNRILIAGKKMLSAKPLNFSLPLDTSINEISMYAENLGSIPPNTALCIVYAGEQRFELIMASNFVKNSAIRFRRRPKENIAQ